jgi:hypothetical protein
LGGRAPHRLRSGGPNRAGARYHGTGDQLIHDDLYDAWYTRFERLGVDEAFEPVDTA